MAPATKRRKLNQIEEITFDPAARREYLTGFHKRKQERKEHARDTAVKKAREEKVEERRQLREKRKEELDKHVAAVNEELRKQNADMNGSESQAESDSGREEVEWNGVANGVPEVEQDEEYVDEDKYTTVTVEAMETLGEESEDDAVHGAETSRAKQGATGAIGKKRIWSKDAKSTKKKKLKFRYESKAERQATRQKQKTKNSAAKARRIGK